MSLSNKHKSCMSCERVPLPSTQRGLNVSPHWAMFSGEWLSFVSFFSFLRFIYFYSHCISALPAYVYMHHMSGA